MTEHDLVAAQLKLLRRELPASFVIRKHADYATSGDPDLSITGNGKTTWWEVKHATPRVKGTELQRVKAVKLAIAGYCRYIVYERSRHGAFTNIVHPRDINPDGTFAAEALAAGEANYVFVLKFVKQIHGV
jgi:hypothetical protein